jgi:WD40 repeat protein
MYHDFIGHTREIKCLAFSPSAKYLASGSTDKTIRVWNAESQKELAIL